MQARTRRQTSHWPAVLLIVGSGVVSAIQVGKATVALAAIQTDLGVGLAVVSWLLSAFAIVGAVAGVAIGLAVDHVGAKRVAVGGLALQGVCSAAGALSDAAPMLLATRLLEGFGFLAVTVAAPALILEVVPQRARDRAFAIWATFMPVGMTGALLAAPLLGEMGWRGFWMLNAALLISYTALLSILVPPRSASANPRRSISKDVREIIAVAAPWILAGLFTAFSASFFAVFGFLPLLLSERLEVSADLGSALTAVAILASAAGNLVCGLVLARGARPWRVLTIAFGVLALTGMGIFLDRLPGAASYSLSVAFSFIGGFIPVVLIDAAPRSAPHPDLTGAAMGLAMQGNNVGLVVGPAATGLIAAAVGWSFVAFFVAGLAMTAVALILLYRMHLTDHDRCPGAHVVRHGS